MVKFVFSKKVPKIDEIFTFDMSNRRWRFCQYFVNICGLLSKHELYLKSNCNRSFFGRIEDTKKAFWN